MTPKEREALKHEINLVLTDPDTTLSHGAHRALDYVIRLLDDLAQQEHSAPHGEPVAWMYEFYADMGHKGLAFEEQRSAHNTPLYTHPAPVTESHKRTWVNATTWRGLTDEDKKEYVAQDFGGNRLDAMDWAEKRLKEKNT